MDKMKAIREAMDELFNERLLKLLTDHGVKAEEADRAKKLLKYNIYKMAGKVNRVGCDSPLPDEDRRKLFGGLMNCVIQKALDVTLGELRS